LHLGGGNVHGVRHGSQHVLKGYAAADLSDRPAAVSGRSSLVTVTNGMEHQVPSFQTDSDSRRSPSTMRRSHRRDNESLVLDGNPDAFSSLESRVLKPYSRYFDPREIRRVEPPVLSDGTENPRQGMMAR